MKFFDLYRGAAAKNKSLLCVGLDQAEFEFNKKIVDQTADLVCAYKPNVAFYEAEGARGVEQLKAICDYIHTSYPGIPVIIDAKRGDIGSTNEAYAKYIFEYLGGDSVTLHPYQGIGALAAFEKYEDKGLFVLCRTSNPESDEYQKEMWEKLAIDIVGRDGGKKQWGLVFGATHPEELKRVREIVGEMVLLVPGVGTQGGSIDQVLNNENSRGLDMIINASRSIAQAKDPRGAAKELQLLTNIYSAWKE